MAASFAASALARASGRPPARNRDDQEAVEAAARHQDVDLAGAEGPLGDTAEEEPPEPGTAMRPDDEEIGRQLAGRLGKDGLGIEHRVLHLPHQLRLVLEAHDLSELDSGANSPVDRRRRSRLPASKQVAKRPPDPFTPVHSARAVAGADRDQQCCGCQERPSGLSGPFRLRSRITGDDPAGLTWAAAAPTGMRRTAWRAQDAAQSAMKAPDRREREIAVAAREMHSLGSDWGEEGTMATTYKRVSKLEEQLELWAAKLNEVAARARVVGQQANIDSRRQLGELKTRLASAQSKLDEAKAAGSEKWDTFRHGVEHTWQELEGAFKKLMH
jgi:hypothetical protein